MKRGDVVHVRVLDTITMEARITSSIRTDDGEWLYEIRPTSGTGARWIRPHRLTQPEGDEA